MKLIRESAVPRLGASYNSRMPRSRRIAETCSTSVTRYASCWSPGPERSRNFAIVEVSSIGASSWMQDPESPTATMASRTPCSSLVSWCWTSIPNESL